MTGKRLTKPMIDPDINTKAGSSEIKEPRDKSQDKLQQEDEAGSSSSKSMAAVGRQLVPVGRLQRAVCGEGGDQFKLFNPIVKWKDIPVKIYINTSGSLIPPDTFTMTVRNSIKSFEVMYGKPFWEVVTAQSMAKATVGWKKEDGAGSTVAITRYSWGSGGWLSKADITLDTSEKWVHRLAETCGAYGDKFDCWNVLEHEFLHAVGLDHVNDAFSSLYPSVRFGETLRRDPNPGDKKGFWALYGGAVPEPAGPTMEEIRSAVEHIKYALQLLE
jgi:hypothetical protein